MLLVALVEEKAIAIARLNLDPYSHNPLVARLRHLSVGSAWRKRGVGKLLVSQIVHKASQDHEILTLRTDNPEADKFYQALGFDPDSPMLYATHYLKLNSN